MKNPNSPIKRLKSHLRMRWSLEDYPGAEPRFQMILFAKDIAIFILLPVVSVITFKACQIGLPTRQHTSQQQSPMNSANFDTGKSQIIDFRSRKGLSPLAGIAKRAPGSLIKLRLLNVVETYSTAPLHAQIVDIGLGQRLLGGSFIGDATPDSNFERINITFNYVRDPNREGVAVPVVARALSLDGTLGLVAAKKEGFFTRSVLGSAGSASQATASQTTDTSDFKLVLFKALTAGLMKEFAGESQVARNRSQVLTLSPGAEFFAELTDFFPGNSK
jgi:hypothetical protein